MAGGIRIATRSDYADRPVQLQSSARLTGDQDAASAAWLAQIVETDRAPTAQGWLPADVIPKRWRTSPGGRRIARLARWTLTPC